MSGERIYGVVGPGAFLPPDYDRVVRALSLEELEDEIARGRGDAEYRSAAVGELGRRGEAEAAETPSAPAPSPPEASKRPRGR